VTFKPKTWHPIALTLSAVNFAGAGLAIGAGEVPHMMLHVALALGFGYWAQRLRPAAGVSDDQARIDLLEGDVDQLRRELTEAQERLDFTERVLAQGAETRRIEP
jgi:hypothetical protein